MLSSRRLQRHCPRNRPTSTRAESTRMPAMDQAPTLVRAGGRLLREGDAPTREPRCSTSARQGVVRPQVISLLGELAGALSDQDRSRAGNGGPRAAPSTRRQSPLVTHKWGPAPEGGPILPERRCIVSARPRRQMAGRPMSIEWLHQGPCRRRFAMSTWRAA